MSAPRLLNGRRALVTGGGRGIGAETVATFASMGCRGVAVDLPGTPWELPPGWTSVEADVTDESQVHNAVTRAVSDLGGIDAVVAAAGVVPAWQSPEELDLADFDRVLAINAGGVASVLKHVSEHLAEGASIVVVGSLNSWRGDPHIWSYVASKHAVLGLVRSAAAALGPQGVRVNCVGPGPIATPALLERMRRRAGDTGSTPEEALAAAARQTALGRIATTADVAHTLAFLTSDLAHGITGQLIAVDGGLL
jgi:NAD(P)-dependent dehydrogenase (short-subunit alcohol dehydrogenase family)